MLLSLIPCLDVHADHQICLVSLLGSVITSPPLSPFNEDRNPVHWAYLCLKFYESQTSKFLQHHHLVIILVAVFSEMHFACISKCQTLYFVVMLHNMLYLKVLIFTKIYCVYTEK